MKVSVLGLGKLGLPLLATCASKGFLSYGYDINKEILSKLGKSITDSKETSLATLIKKFKKKIITSESITDAVLNSDITFVVTPTPSKKNGSFSNKYIFDVVKGIAHGLKVKSKYHLVVIVSTIMPNSTNQARKILEKNSGKMCGKDFGLCYNPEFIALGSVVENLLNPDFVLIGQSDTKSGDILEQFYLKFCNNRPKIMRMNFVNAELTKISLNTYVTTKISYANMLTEICEKLPEGDVDVITNALGLDSRIGTKYLKGGPSFGGPCFPRDNLAFIYLARKLKSNFQLPLATHKTNLQQTDRLVKIIMQYSANSKIGILGLSYKPFTDVIEESFGLILAKKLLQQKKIVNVHDPVALENVEKVFKDQVKYFNNIKECIEESEVVVISCNWPQYKAVDKFFKSKAKKILIDPWRMINPKSLSSSVIYVPVGQNINYQ
ncbi:MAG: nucleotide sugar dehydrogenase [Candidatus Daviesbacteria bacterium]|nr:nucleotide sugar dehydrogenase [Candidatus Daviesbacteria bacterium]